jgi:hypothetical protein
MLSLLEDFPLGRFGNGGDSSGVRIVAGADDRMFHYYFWGSWGSSRREFPL